MPQPAARVFDPVGAFGGVILPPGVLTVLIEGQPAANMTALHGGCMFPPPPAAPHMVGPALGPGSLTVHIGGAPALRMGDSFAPCGQPVVMGAKTVLIG